MRRIYTLNGLPPEVIAVAFAKTSRSPLPFDEIANELNEDKSRQFHEKWVVGYGHSSVAEHAVISIAIENVSILATKVIEDNRLCSYTEKSTRYQVFDKTRYLKPKKIMTSELAEVYENTSDFILDKYTELFPKMIEFLKQKQPKDDETSERLYEMIIKNKALDALRYMLPVSVLTNLGWTANARNLEWGIVKLMTHELDELKEIGEEVKEAATKITPTLIKYTKYSEFLGETEKALTTLSKETLNDVKAKDHPGTILVEFDEEAEDKIVAAILYRFSHLPYREIKEKVQTMTMEEKEKIFDEALKRMGKHDRPLRELEQAYYTFDILMDYGAFRDIQRHRLVTQINQDFTVEHNYCTPKEIKEAGMLEEYDDCMKKAKDAYYKIYEKFPKEAQYIIPLAYNKRVLFRCNLRELYHFIKLRSSKMGHISYRKIAQQMFELIKVKHPMLVKYLQCDME